MLANESDFVLHFSLNWEEKQFKSIFQEKEDSGNLLYFAVLHRPANYSVIIYALLSVTNCKIKLTMADFC